MRTSRLLGPAALFGSASFFLSLASHSPGHANANPTADTPLQLELQSAEITAGMPSRFLFRLVNRTDHEVRLSNPAVACADGMNGTIGLRVEFHPLHPGDSTSGGGCVYDFFGEWPSILIRLQSWKTVKAGEAMALEVPRETFHYSDQKPGQYEFWATYTPPFIKKEDQKLLLNAGIDFPKGELVSTRLVFEKKP